jgi:hypothetical protein
MIHLRLPVESSAIPAAWPCAVARPKTKPPYEGMNTRRSADTLPHRDRPAVPRSLCPLPDARIGFESATPQIRQKHIHWAQTAVGPEKTRTATLQWLAQPLGSWGLIPHSAVHRKSVSRKSDIRSRAVGAYLRTDRRHTVQLVRVASAPRLNCGVGCKEPIPSSFNKTGSTKAATSRRGNSQRDLRRRAAFQSLPDRITFFAKEYARDLTRAGAAL